MVTQKQEQAPSVEKKPAIPLGQLPWGSSEEEEGLQSHSARGMTLRQHEEQVEAEDKAARKLQAVHRGNKDRQRVELMKAGDVSPAESANSVHSGVWHLSHQHEEQRLGAAATKLQAVHRGNQDRQRVELMKAGDVSPAESVGSGHSGVWHISHRHDEQQRVEATAAVKIQAIHRGNQDRAELGKKHDAATRIQAVRKGNVARNQVDFMKAGAFSGAESVTSQHSGIFHLDHRHEEQTRAETAAALQIQALHRGNRDREDLRQQQTAAARIQAVHRGNAVRADIQEQHEAASRIQSGFFRSRNIKDATEASEAKGTAGLRRDEPSESADEMEVPDEVKMERSDAPTTAEHEAASKIQAIQRGNAARAELQEKQDAAVRIQAAYKGNVARAELLEQHEAASKVQAVYRGNAVRAEIQEQHEAAAKVQAVYRGNAARTGLQQQKDFSATTSRVKAEAQVEGTLAADPANEEKQQGMVVSNMPTGSSAEHEAAVKIQAIQRGNAARADLQEQQDAAVRIQAAYKGNVARAEIQEQHEAAAKVQAVYRGNATRAEIQEQHEAAAKVQAVYKGNVARAELQEQHEAAAKIQVVYKGTAVRADVQEQHEAAERIQAVYKGNAVRADLQEQHEAAAKVQAAYRGNAVRAELQQKQAVVAQEAQQEDLSAPQSSMPLEESSALREQHDAAAKIQAVYKGNAVRADLGEQHEAASKLQAAYRGNVARAELEEQHEAAAKIQAVYKGSAVRADLQEQHDAAEKIQAVYKGNVVRADLQEQHEAAAKVQAVYKGNLARAELQEQHEAAAKVQAVFKGNAARAELLEQHEAAAKVQAVYKGNVARAELQQQHDAAEKIQAVYKGNAARAELQAQDDAAAKIQAVYKGSVARADLQEQHAAASMIQAVYKGNALRTNLDVRIKDGVVTERPVSEQRTQAGTDPEQVSHQNRALSEQDTTSPASAYSIRDQRIRRGEGEALSAEGIDDMSVRASAAEAEEATSSKGSPGRRLAVDAPAPPSVVAVAREHEPLRQGSHQAVAVSFPNSPVLPDRAVEPVPATTGILSKTPPSRAADAGRGDGSKEVAAARIQAAYRGKRSRGGRHHHGRRAQQRSPEVHIDLSSPPLGSRTPAGEADAMLSPKASPGHMASPRAVHIAEPNSLDPSATDAEEEGTKEQRMAEQRILRDRMCTAGFETPAFSRPSFRRASPSFSARRAPIGLADRKSRAELGKTALGIRLTAGPGEPQFLTAQEYADRDGNRPFVIYKNTLLRYFYSAARFTSTILQPRTWRMMWRFLHSLAELDQEEFARLANRSASTATPARQLLSVYDINAGGASGDDDKLDFYAPPEYVEQDAEQQLAGLIHQLTDMPWRYCLAVDIGGSRTKFKFVDTNTDEVCHLAKMNSQDLWETYDPAISLREYLSKRISSEQLRGVDRIIFSVPGTIDISQAVRAEEMTVVKNMPAFSSTFRGFDFKARFKPYFPQAKVSAVCDNLAAAIGCAAKYPNVTQGLVLVLGTAPACATFNRKGNEGLETGMWQSWVWFTKMSLKDPYGYAGGVKIQDNGKKIVTNPPDFVKMPHKQARIRFALDNRTWLRLQGKEPTLPAHHQGSLSVEEATVIWVERLKGALRALAQKFHSFYGPPDAIFVLGGNSLQVHGKFDEIRYDNPEVLENGVGRRSNRGEHKTYVPVFTCATDAEQQDTTMVGLLQSSRFKVKQVYSSGSDPLDRGWTRGGEIYHWVLRSSPPKTSGRTGSQGSAADARARDEILAGGGSEHDNTLSAGVRHSLALAEAASDDHDRLRTSMMRPEVETEEDTL